MHATTIYLLQQCVTTFLNVVESLKNEAVVVQSPTAPQLKEVLERFNDNPDCELLAVELFTLLEHCFLPDLLKSIAKGHMWSAFHQFRLGDQPKDAWRKFMACSPLLPAHLNQHADQCLQLIIDRLFKRIITMKKKKLHTTSHTPPDPKLSDREDNVVYYMSRFVAFKFSLAIKLSLGK